MHIIVPPFVIVSEREKRENIDCSVERTTGKKTLWRKLVLWIPHKLDWLIENLPCQAHVENDQTANLQMQTWSKQLLTLMHLVSRTYGHCTCMIHENFAYRFNRHSIWNFRKRTFFCCKNVKFEHFYSWHVYDQFPMESECLSKRCNISIHSLFYSTKLE